MWPKECFNSLRPTYQPYSSQKKGSDEAETFFQVQVQVLGSSPPAQSSAVSVNNAGHQGGLQYPRKKEII